MAHPKLNLVRNRESEHSVIGELFYIAPNGVSSHLCYTLEPSSRLKQHPCIPAGDYSLILSFSPKFRRNLPLILGVHGRDGIRIHSGNTYLETYGCILVGLSVNGEELTDSRICERFVLDVIKSKNINTISIYE